MRNKNVDIIRAFALLWVIIYHIWVLSGSAAINNAVASVIVSLGGEMGVTMFFMISGFGVYCALKRDEAGKGLSFPEFIKRRAIRIVPEYYLSIFIVLLFSKGAIFLSKEGVISIVLHLLFLNNFWGQASGTINGLLWTLALTFQFYILAIPMYRLLKKTKYLFPVMAVGITVLYKFIMFHFLMGRVFDMSAFGASRTNPVAVADNFALGMFTAYLLEEKAEKWKNNKIVNTLMVGVSIVLLYIVGAQGIANGIHTDNLSGYTWHSLVAVVLSILIFFYAKNDTDNINILKKSLLRLAHYEYGIYLVHMLVINYMIDHLPIVRNMISLNWWLKYVVFVCVSIFAGWCFTKLSDGIRRLIA